MARVIFHLDMDAFYASIEQRENPKLRGKPVIVGSPPTQRGVVCAASYEARAFGVRSAMPSSTAGRLCPNGVFVRPQMEKYKAESTRIMVILARTGAVIEPMSIDEAYLDLSAIVGQASSLPHLIGPETDNLATTKDGPQLGRAGGTPALLSYADEALHAAVPIAPEIKRNILAEC